MLSEIIDIAGPIVEQMERVEGPHKVKCEKKFRILSVDYSNAS